jgi:hypothetical protein
MRNSSDVSVCNYKKINHYGEYNTKIIHALNKLREWITIQTPRIRHLAAAMRGPRPLEMPPHVT